MSKPECLQALETINNDPKAWDTIFEISPDTFLEWWQGKSDMPDLYYACYTYWISVLLDFTERDNDGEFRGKYSSAYPFLKLAKSKVQKFPQNIKDNAKKIIEDHLLKP